MRFGTFSCPVLAKNNLHNSLIAYFRCLRLHQRSTQPDIRIRRIHHDWLGMPVRTRSVAQLSSQLRRFLDDMTLLENRRIAEIMRSIEARAISLRNEPPKGEITTIPGVSASVELPMERPLHRAKVKVKLKSTPGKHQDINIDTSALFSQVVIDKAILKRNIRKALQERSTISLSELIQLHPLEKGLAELIAYFQLATDSFTHIVQSEHIDSATWLDEPKRTRSVLCAYCICEVKN